MRIPSPIESAAAVNSLAMLRTSHWVLKLLVAAGVLALLAVVYLDARITATFSDRMWDMPAKVYARPLELFPGKALTPDDLAYELSLLGYRSVRSARRPGEYSRNGGTFDLYTRGFHFPDEREPARPLRLRIAQGRIAGLTDAGRALALLRLEPVEIGGIYPVHGEDRILVKLEEVPPTMIEALLAVEDRDFYSHWGFSVSGIARAALSNLRSGQVVAGGSTITQQLVKNYYLSPERTLVRKFIEVVMAVLLEVHYSKEQILESYINEVYLGQDGPRSIHGFALASRHYFDQPLHALGLHQQALLVGMIKGPSLFNPERNPERARRRRELVLSIMAEADVISAEHQAVASAMPLGLARRRTVLNAFPAFLELVRRQLPEEYRAENLSRDGLRIFTGFDPLLQRQLEESTARVMDGFDPGGELQSATVVTRLDTGEIAALVGGRQVRYAGFNRALDARRPAGSLLKPAVYLAALEQPERYTLATLLQDTPLTVGGPGGQRWQPRNFDRKSHGRVLLHRSLANSYNLATARLGMDLGVEAVVDMLDRLGVTAGVPGVPAVTLGAGEYSPLAMATMYQTIAAGGFNTPLRAVRDIVDASGQSLRRYELLMDRRVSLQAMHLLHHALVEVVREGTGVGVYRQLDSGFDVAGKTGTTNDGRDSWFAGFSGDLMAVTWVGRDDNGKTGLTGSSGALRIWSHFMARASRRPLGYRMPDGMHRRWVDDTTGLLTAQGCSDAQLLPFVAGSEPVKATGCMGSDQPVAGWLQSLLGRSR